MWKRRGAGAEIQNMKPASAPSHMSHKVTWEQQVWVPSSASADPL